MNETTPSESAVKYANRCFEELNSLKDWCPAGSTCARNIRFMLDNAIMQIQGELEYAKQHQLP